MCAAQAVIALLLICFHFVSWYDKGKGKARESRPEVWCPCSICTVATMVDKVGELTVLSYVPCHFSVQCVRAYTHMLKTKPHSIHARISNTLLNFCTVLSRYGTVPLIYIADFLSRTIVCVLNVTSTMQSRTGIHSVYVSVYEIGRPDSVPITATTTTTKKKLY